MSMTREEAIEIFEQKGWWIAQKETLTYKQAEEIIKLNNAVNFALSALHPVSRERIEKVWKGEWIKERRQTYIPVEYDEQGEVILHDFVVYRCSICGRENTKEEPFCNCGAPMTDEAVEMVMERLEALNEKD